MNTTPFRGLTSKAALPPSGLRLALALATSIGALGCGASGDLPEPVPGLPEAFSAPGVYSVPADPTVLFPVRAVDVWQDSGIVTVYYELPSEFDAVDSHVTLTGAATTNGPFYLEGKAGMSVCSITGALLACNERLTGVACGHTEVGGGHAPRTPEVMAAEAFCNEPIGTLRVEVPAEP